MKTPQSISCVKFRVGEKNKPVAFYGTGKVILPEQGWKPSLDKWVLISTEDKGRFDIASFVAYPEKIVISENGSPITVQTGYAGGMSAKAIRGQGFAVDFEKTEVTHDTYRVFRYRPEVLSPSHGEKSVVFVVGDKCYELDVKFPEHGITMTGKVDIPIPWKITEWPIRGWLKTPKSEKLPVVETPGTIFCQGFQSEYTTEAWKLPWRIEIDGMSEEDIRQQLSDMGIDMTDPRPKKADGSFAGYF